MRLPRDISAARLIQLLERLGYDLVRQAGSHAQLIHLGPPRHRVTIPRHDPVKVGLLGAVLKEVAERQSITVEALVERL